MSVLKSVGKWVNKTWAQEASSNQILEPFSTLLKLAIISYKSDGPKIAIYKLIYFLYLFDLTYILLKLIYL